MALSRLLLAWGAVTLLLTLWREAERRVLPAPGDAAPSLSTLVVEALLLTLLAGLWFGSLGSGGAALLFLVVGALLEIPARLRTGTWSWKAIGIGIARVTLAGVLLGVVLG